MILAALSSVVLAGLPDMPLRVYVHDYTFIAPPARESGTTATMYDPNQVVVLSESAKKRHDSRRAELEERLRNGFSANGTVRVGFTYGKSYAEKPIVDWSTGTINGRYWRQARMHETIIDATELSRSRFDFDVRRVCNRIGEKLFLTGFFDGSRADVERAIRRGGTVRGLVRGRGHSMNVKRLRDGRIWAYEENEATQSPRSQATYIVSGFEPRSGRPAQRVEITTVSTDRLIREIYDLRTSYELRNVFGWCGPVEKIPEGALSRDGRGLAGTSNSIQ